MTPAVLLQHVAWWCAPDESMARYAGLQSKLEAVGVEHHLLVSAADEEQARRARGVRGAHLSHNLHVNEQRFHPRDVQRSFDAIYIAQLRDYKRLELARDVPRLRVVSYGGDLHGYCPVLAHAEFNRSLIAPDAVAEAICGAHCGLCLSAVEGGMLAAMEYLLCGRPVVTTESRGGRDEFFDDRNSITVAPDSRAVAEAVATWCERGADPARVRAGALERLLRLRRRFCEYVAGIIAAHGGGAVTPGHLERLLYASPGGIRSRAIPSWAPGHPGALGKFRFELPAERPAPAPGVRLVDDGGRLELQMNGRRSAACNGPAAMIWELCDGRRSVGDIAELIRSSVPGAPRDVELEVGATLRRFVELGAVTAA